jgi:hypothetical protein
MEACPELLLEHLNFPRISWSPSDTALLIQLLASARWSVHSQVDQVVEQGKEIIDWISSRV